MPGGFCSCRSRENADEPAAQCDTLRRMHRILILDGDEPRRAQLIEAIHRAAHTEVVLAQDEDELIAKLKVGIYAAVFADADLLSDRASPLIAATRAAISRPMVVIAAAAKVDDFDPDMVTLLVRKPYDVHTLTGILLSAIIPPLTSGEPKSDTTSVC
jgi:hypothetical protein